MTYGRISFSETENLIAKHDGEKTANYFSKTEFSLNTANQ